MTFASAERAYLTPPEPHEYGDDPGTKCLGSYPADERTDAWECDQQVVCPLCDGIVCEDHDETQVCDGYVVHEQCHRQGCQSVACAEDARDDAILAREEERDGR